MNARTMVLVLALLTPVLCRGQLFKNDSSGVHTLGAPGLFKGGDKQADTSATPEPEPIPFAFDAVSSKAATASAVSHSWNHTCTGTDSMGALIVGVSLGACEEDVSTISATYGAQAMTEIAVTKNPDGCLQAYIFKLMNPPSGTAAITITYGEAHSLSGGAISYTGASAVNGLGDVSGTSATVGGTVTSASGRIVVMVAVAGSNQSFSPGTGVTEMYDVMETVGNKPGAMGIKNGALSVTIQMTLDLGSDDWAAAFCEILP